MWWPSSALANETPEILTTCFPYLIPLLPIDGSLRGQGREWNCILRVRECRRAIAISFAGYQLRSTRRGPKCLICPLNGLILDHREYVCRVCQHRMRMTIAV